MPSVPCAGLWVIILCFRCLAFDTVNRTILKCLVKCCPQAIPNPGLRAEPVGPQGNGAIGIVLSPDDLNLAWTFFNGIPIENF